MTPRPPIVVVMGHVDHGKTTLLDYIRKTTVADREAGSITQSIGAYEIAHNGKKITFIDTPGHEAFIKMRTRGAHAADLAILVVAADEGVKPQTQESVKILEESETPFVVAITKTDKTGADVEKVKNELTAAGVLLEGYGGHVSFEPISVKSGEGIHELLDFLLLAAEVEHLEYDPAAPATGFVLEAKTSRQRGSEVTLILTDGTLRRNDPIRTPTAFGRIKILEDFAGKAAGELLPSAPALVVGFEDLPQVGEKFVCGEAASVELTAPQKHRLAKQAAAPLPAVTEETDTLNLILKASDAGSIEALSEIVRALPAEKPLKIVDESIGDVKDNDVNLAIAGKAMIIAFRSRTEKGARMLAETNRVKIISSDIIYDLVKTVEDVLKGKEEAARIGELDVLAIFNQKKPERQLVGGKVVAGILRNKAPFTVLRGGVAAGTGRIMNLQQQKKDAAQVEEGKEAGLLVSSTVLIAVGDRLVVEGK